MEQADEIKKIKWKEPCELELKGELHKPGLMETG